MRGTTRCFVGIDFSTGGRRGTVRFFLTRVGNGGCRSVETPPAEDDEDVCWETVSLLVFFVVFFRLLGVLATATGIEDDVEADFLAEARLCSADDVDREETRWTTLGTLPPLDDVDDSVHDCGNAVALDVANFRFFALVVEEEVVEDVETLVFASTATLVLRTRVFFFFWRVFGL